MGRRPGSRNRTKRQAISFPFDTDQQQPTDTMPVQESTGKSSLEFSVEEKKRQAKLEADIPQIFTPEQVVFVFDLYIGLLSLIFVLILKTDVEPIYDELKFDEEEKLQLARPLARIASKYAPSEWAGMQPEIELITILGIKSVMSFSVAKKIAQKTEERKKMEQQQKHAQRTDRPAPTVIPRNTQTETAETA